MIDRKCEFSPDRLHRYTLWREWDMFNRERFVQFVGLNPSTADEVQNDPTIRRCMDFAQSWGYGAMCMTNLFAFRATLPQVMKDYADPVGPDNLEWILRVAKEASLIVAAWGLDGEFKHQGRKVSAMLGLEDIKVHCIAFTKSGFPKHPLYIPGSEQPKPYNFTPS